MNSQVKIRFVPQDRLEVFGEIEVHKKHLDEIRSKHLDGPPYRFTSPMSWVGDAYVIIAEDLADAFCLMGQIQYLYPLGQPPKYERDTPKVRLTLSVDNQTYSEHELEESDLDKLAPVFRYLKAYPYMKGNTGIVALASPDDAHDLAQTIWMYIDVEDQQLPEFCRNRG